MLLSLLVTLVKWTEVIWNETRPLSFLASPLLSISGVNCCAETLEGLFLFQTQGSFLKKKKKKSPQTISTNMSSNSNLSNMRRLVEQLKLEASVERIKVKNRKKTVERKRVQSLLMS